MVLLFASAIALIWANSPWRHSYEGLLHLSVGLRLGRHGFERDVHFWLNDGCMTVFFFVVGLEIKREVHAGHLSDWRRAALPAFAALGGMVAPAVLFLAFNGGTPAAGGWGIPMATDIAFAVGLLALLGKRIPPAARILLLALAVVDDLGSILVIALFYSSTVNPLGLLLALAGLGVIVGLQKLGVRSPWSYLPAALATWAGTYMTGVHPTIAGVAIGLLTPVRPEPPELALAANGAMSPADYLYNRLHRWVAFIIMPAFAFANAGMTIGDLTFSSLERRVVLGVVLGLVIGKPLGVLGFAWLAIRSRLAVLPAGVGWSSMLVVGLVAGVGFTIALFISSLAFASETLSGAAKLGILLASTIAAMVGLVTGRLLLPRSSSSSAKGLQQHP